MSTWPETIHFGTVNHAVFYNEVGNGLWSATAAFKRSADGNAYTLSEDIQEAEFCVEAGVGANHNEAFDLLGKKVYLLLGDQFESRPNSVGGAVIDGL